jgi:hypothetical protein
VLDPEVVRMSQTTAGVVGASVSIIGGFVAVFAVALTANGRQRWVPDEAEGPRQPLVIRQPRPAHHRVAHARPEPVRVTVPVSLPARPARRVAVAAHRVRAVVHVRRVARPRRVARHHAKHRAVRRKAPVAPAVPAPVVAPPAPPAPVVAHEKKLPPGQLKKLTAAAHVPPGQLKKQAAAAVHIPPGQLKKLGASAPAVGQTAADEEDRGSAPGRGHRGHGRGKGARG